MITMDKAIQAVLTAFFVGIVIGGCVIGCVYQERIAGNEYSEVTIVEGGQ